MTLRLLPTLELLPTPERRRSCRAWARPFLGWCRAVREFGPHSLRAYADALEAFCAFAETHGLTFPEQVTPAAVEAFCATLRHRDGLSIATANHRRHVLITFFRYLEREQVVSTNPAKVAFGLTPPRRLPDVLTPPEQQRVLEAVPGAQGAHAVRDIVLVAVGLLAGLRAAELAALRLADVDLDAGTLRVLQGKGRKDRFVPCVPWLAVTLRRYLAVSRPILLGGRADETLFLSREGRALTTRGIWYLVRRTVSPLVGRAVHPHTLRHSFASRSLAGGATLPAVQKALGHSQMGTTGRYLHLPDAEYVRQFAGWLGGEAPAPTTPPAPLPTLPPVEATPPRRPPAPPHPFANRRVRAALRARRFSRKGRR